MCECLTSDSGLVEAIIIFVKLWLYDEGAVHSPQIYPDFPARVHDDSVHLITLDQNVVIDDAMVVKDFSIVNYRTVIVVQMALVIQIAVIILALLPF